MTDPVELGAASGAAARGDAPGPRARARVGGLLLAFSLGLGATGFIVATGHELSPVPPVVRPAPEDADEASGRIAGLRVAPRYLEIEPGQLSVNAAWNAIVSNALITGPTAADRASFYGAPPATDSERSLALRVRAQRRAYRGAPPVVPHSIDQTGTQACLACHENGFRVGDVVVPPMSHGPLASCTQCHVEASGVPPRGPVLGPGSALLAASGFDGLAEPGAGGRAWRGAPPTIPHSTWMRESCLSCHGTLAEPGLASSHPWRTSCTQCHAPSAALDQVPVAPSPLPLLR